MDHDEFYYFDYDSKMRTILHFLAKDGNNKTMMVNYNHFRIEFDYITIQYKYFDDHHSFSYYFNI